jgi:hypothetical protein
MANHHSQMNLTEMAMGAIRIFFRQGEQSENLLMNLHLSYL